MRVVFGHFFAFASLCVLAALCPGCGGNGPRMAPVEGVVTLDGEVLGGASVLFHPRAGGRPATGVTDALGKFELKTMEDEGARVGMNEVSVAKEKKVQTDIEIGEGEYGEVEFETPAKYASPKLSGLSVDVQPGMEPVRLDLASEVRP